MTNSALTNGHTPCSSYRQYLPDLTTPRFTQAKNQDAAAYTESFIQNRNPPLLYKLIETWQQLYEEPFRGVTCDGNVRPNLYRTQDEGVEIEKIVQATNAALGQLSSEQKGKVQYPVNAREWRAWSNPEMLLRNFGLRLEDVSEASSSAILDILEVSFSEKGYMKAVAAMQINEFLGELTGLTRVMNSQSYNFLLFGTPSTTEYWGWSLYGHHLCLNVFLSGRQMVIAPTFTGAEPNLIDSGPLQGTEILQVEGNLGLKLMQGLNSKQQSKAQVYKLLHDPAMLQTGDLSRDRWNQDDQRHMCGAFRDNRIVPYEGVCVSEMSEDQQHMILEIAEEFLLYLPDTAREVRKALIKEYFGETYFCWIGSYGKHDAFYYRIQSPVAIFEFDHHSGVFLTNKEPARFHIHTLVRMPNGGDYGNALRKSDEQL